jgi:hypothetical protein
MLQNPIPIEVISYTNKAGKIRPYRFRVDNGTDAMTTFAISAIFSADMKRMAGNKIIQYKCEINHNGILKHCDLQYELDTCTWMFIP